MSLFVFASLFFVAFSAPLPAALDAVAPLDALDTLVTIVTTTVEETATVTQVVAHDFTPLFSAPPVPSTSITIASQTTPTAVFVTAVVTATLTASASTITSIALQAPPITITKLVTVTAPSPASTYLSSDLVTTPYTSTSATPTSWALGPQFTNMNCLNISKFAYGKQNLAVVQGIPVNASQTVSAPVSQATPSSFHTWNNATDNAIQLFFPAGSINPGQTPQGGADWYATPIPMENASNVTLQYSVFIDRDFEFVKGGKLPGLYGGHTGCSGGDIATECFSTRLMWRADGLGELYLYAPRDRQLPSLCQTGPMSVCDSEYGLSIGRGSFNFTRGAWTHLSQTVRLNTPGVQDGGFTLDVNGHRVLSLEGVFYRAEKSDVASPPSSSAPTFTPPGSQTVWWTPSPTSSFAATPTSSPANGLLDSALDGLGGTSGTSSDSSLLGGLLGKRDVILLIAPPSYAASAPALQMVSADQDQTLVPEVGASSSLDSAASAAPTTAPASIVTVYATITEPPLAPYASPTPSAALLAASTSTPEAPFGFSGIFFSSFFGGHEPEWASPKDQWMWFSSFGVIINA